MRGTKNAYCMYPNRRSLTPRSVVTCSIVSRIDREDQDEASPRKRSTRIKKAHAKKAKERAAKLSDLRGQSAIRDYVKPIALIRFEDISACVAACNRGVLAVPFDLQRQLLILVFGPPFLLI